jgi:Uma2 family endonuclease
MIPTMPTETIGKKLFTADEFEQMHEAGILSHEERFELIRGEIIEMPRPLPPHSGTVDRLAQVFSLRFGGAVTVRVQNPYRIDRYSEPIPDIALLKPRSDFYTKAHPGPQDVFLLLEVSHTTVHYDKTVKALLYAESGAPEYWQLDLTKDVLIVRTDPQDAEYQNVRVFRRGENITIGALPAFSFSLDELLGPPHSSETNL